ncbi:hypothetical protein P9112_007768 [Eukaryota sp. TZLM1-RC]
MSVNLTKLGESLFDKSDKVNTEIFVLTYGSVVTSVLKTCESVDAANDKLEKLGYNMGIRLVDDFLVKTQLSCKTFKDAIDCIKVGFKMYLNVYAESFSTGEVHGSEPVHEYSLELKGNPINDYVELPNHLSGLRYLAILSGVIKGCLSQVGHKVEVRETGLVLRGDRADVLRIKYLGVE